MACVGWIVVGAECTVRESRRARERGIMATGARGEVDKGEALSDCERGGGGGMVRDMLARTESGQSRCQADGGGSRDGGGLEKEGVDGR